MRKGILRKRILEGQFRKGIAEGHFRKGIAEGHFRKGMKGTVHKLEFIRNFSIFYNNQFCETGSVYAQTTAVANNIER